VGGDQDIVTLPGHGFTHQALYVAVRVEIGSIEHRDAGIKSETDGPGAFARADRAVCAGECHGAKSDRR
jgi:hypothetical protein